MLFLLLVSILVIPAITDPIICTKERAAYADLKLLTKIIKQYHAIFGRFPKTVEGIDVLVNHRLLPKLPRDPWNNAYHYQLINREYFSVCSFGENKTDEQGTGDDLCNTHKQVQE